jgi:hypothetical protein
MTESLQVLLSELERFGEANDNATIECPLAQRSPPRPTVPGIGTRTSMLSTASPGARIASPLAASCKVARHRPANAWGPQVPQAATPISRGPLRKLPCGAAETIPQRSNPALAWKKSGQRPGLNPPGPAAGPGRRLERVRLDAPPGLRVGPHRFQYLFVPPDARSATPHTSHAKAYWITSSACKRSVAGMVRPSAWAVLRLMTSLKVIGRSTGRSPGGVPLRILAT